MGYNHYKNVHVGPPWILNVSIPFHVRPRHGGLSMILKTSPDSSNVRQILESNCFGPTKGPIDQYLIYLKSSLLDTKYTNTSHVKSNVQYPISTFIILILNIKLT